RVRRDDDVDLAVPDVRLSVRGHRLDPVDAALRDAELFGDDLADLDVEAFRLPVRRDEAEQRLVELRADRDGAGVVERGHRAARGELLLGGRVGRARAPGRGRGRGRGLGVVAATGGE